MPGRPRSSTTTSGWRSTTSFSASSPVGRQLHVVAPGPQVRGQGPPDLRLVVDHQHRVTTPTAKEGGTPDRQRDGEGEPPTGGVLDPEPPAHGGHEPTGDGQAEADAGAAAVAEPLKRLEHGPGGPPAPPGPGRSPAARPGPPADASTRTPRSRWDGGRWRRRWRPPARAGQVGHDRGHVRVHRSTRPAAARCCPGPRPRPRRARPAERRPRRPALDPAHVEQVGRPGSSRSISSSMVWRKSRWSHRPFHVVRQQAGRRGLDRRQRPAQVVRHGPQDGGAQSVAPGGAAALAAGLGVRPPLEGADERAAKARRMRRSSRRERRPADEAGTPRELDLVAALGGPARSPAPPAGLTIDRPPPAQPALRRRRQEGGRTAERGATSRCRARPCIAIGELPARRGGPPPPRPEPGGVGRAPGQRPTRMMTASTRRGRGPRPRSARGVQWKCAAAA